MFQNKLVEALPTIILVGVVTLGITWGYAQIKQRGFIEGAASVQEKWDKQVAEHENAIKELKEHYAIAEEAHRTENRRISFELSQANSRHQVELADTRAEYERRLQSSSSRSVIYQRQAEAGASECRNLASHASRLDSSLEEGRSLVRELGATVRLRDRQIKALSDQINNDRELTK